MTDRPKPPWSILDSKNPWTPAANTDVAATFARVRARMAAEQAQRATVVKVTPITRQKGKA